MTDFTRRVNEEIGPDAVEGMVARDLKYKRNARIRQIIIITLLIILIIIIFFNILILRQTAESNDQILKKLLDAFPSQPK